MKKILIMEDIPIIYEELVSIISNLLPDNEIVLINNEKAAIESLKNNSFDLIVLDGELNHPKSTKGHGRHILQHMTEDQKKITVVNSSDNDFVFEAEDKGIKFSLCRKNDEDDLLLIIKKLFL